MFQSCPAPFHAHDQRLGGVQINEVANVPPAAQQVAGTQLLQDVALDGGARGQGGEAFARLVGFGDNPGLVMCVSCGLVVWCDQPVVIFSSARIFRRDFSQRLGVVAHDGSPRRQVRLTGSDLACKPCVDFSLDPSGRLANFYGRGEFTSVDQLVDATTAETDVVRERCEL
jgi:hypothetical protein